MSKDLYSVTKDLEQKEKNRIKEEKRLDKKNDPDNFSGLRWGIVSGLAMSLYLVGIQLLGYNDNIALKFFKYIFLFVFIGYALSAQKSRMGSNYSFGHGMKLGSFVTISSAFMLVAMNLLLFSWTDTLAFDKFTQAGNNLADVAMISGILFFEVLVFGLIITFIGLQYLKPRQNGR